MITFALCFFLGFSIDKKKGRAFWTISRNWQSSPFLHLFQNDAVRNRKRGEPLVSEERERERKILSLRLCWCCQPWQRQSHDLTLLSSSVLCLHSKRVSPENEAETPPTSSLERKCCPFLIPMALPSCLKTTVPMSPTTGFNLSGSLMKSDSGFAVPTKLQSIRKGDRERLRIQAVFSFPPAFLTRNGRTEKQKQLKQDLLEAIAPLERGATASPDDQLRIDQLARKVEAVNPTKQPLKSDLVNGKWELIYTTSASILQAKKPRFLRSITNYQSINVDTLKVQNMETWPFYNSVTGDLTPLNTKKVAVKLQVFKILGFIPVKAPDSARGELEITYVDEELRLSRGDKGNLFILKMFDPTYRIPL